MKDPIEAKTYYGPWLDVMPKDAQNGSLWQVRQSNASHDRTPRLNAVIVVCLAGCLFDSDGYVSSNDVESIRRVYPPGSVLPEPRPLVVDGKVRDLSSADGWMFMRGTADGMLTRPGWILVTPEDYPDIYRVTLTRHVDSLLHPVQPFNGAFVPIPWPDSGCTTE